MKTAFIPENLNRLSKYSGRVFTFKFGGATFTHTLGRIMYMREIEEFVFDDLVRSEFSCGDSMEETHITSASHVDHCVATGIWTEIIG